jgi:uncharacterized protein (TIGR03435 family)
MRSLTVLAAIACSISLSAQTPERRSFEVASIKRVPDQERTPFSGVTFSRGGRLVGDNVSVYFLIVQAFGGGRPLPPTRIADTPEWVRFETFNIVAKASDAPTDELALSQVRPGYLRGLLEDRFQLKYHWESRQLPAYNLVLARRDGKLGPQLRHRTADCSADPDPPCDVRFKAPGDVTLGGPMAYIVETLSRFAGRLVVDRTRLEGLFDVKLQWTPDISRESNPTGASLTDAVQDQLGLKLESTTSPVDVLVIDRVEHPTEN